MLKIFQTMRSTIFQKFDKSKSSRVIQCFHYQERRFWGRYRILLSVQWMPWERSETSVLLKMSAFPPEPRDLGSRTIPRSVPSATLWLKKWADAITWLVESSRAGTPIEHDVQISPPVDKTQSNTRFFFYKNILSGFKAWKETEIATSKITTMFLNFEPI